MGGRTRGLPKAALGLALGQLVNADPRLASFAMSHTLLHKLVPFLHQSGQLGLDVQHTRTLSLRTFAQFFRKGARMNSMNTGAPKDTTLATFSCMAGMSANIMKARVPGQGIQRNQ